MVEILVIRHAVNDFVKTGKLAGWAPGVHLNDEGKAQATALGVRLSKVKLDAVYSSPLERTVETAQAILEHHPELGLQLLDSVGEVRYGEWQGLELSKLSQRKLWPVIQMTPSRVRFPKGETLRQAQMRAVDALEELAETHPRSRVAVVSHSDIIKLVVAHYLGMHIDLFQRIHIAPASLSIIALGHGRPFVVQINETSYLPPPDKKDQATEGAISEIRPVQGVTVDTVGTPGQRTFYLQAHREDGGRVTLLIEKSQALLLADEVDRLFSTLADNYAAPAHSDIDGASPPALVEPEPALFRAGKMALQYAEDADLISLEVEELVGHDQRNPQILRLWTTRQQARALGKQARSVALAGRNSS